MKNLHKNIGVFAASLLAASSAVYLYSPVIGTHADSTGTADINLNVNEVMSLTLDKNALNLNTAPNNFVSGVITATVSSNSSYGYTLTLEDVDNNTNMVHANENISAVVSSDFEGTKTSSTMDNNTWGFSLNTTDFSKIPVNGSAATIKSTNGPMSTDTEVTPVTFGAKVGNITSGTYTDKILFTLYTNGQDDGDSNDTMQGFNCSDLENVGDSAVLTDTRDNNSYTVKKLADEKCWMTDSLRIANTTITSEDSNLPENDSFIIPESNIDELTETFNTKGTYIDPTYGGYYNFYTATAGWGTSSVTSGNAEKDICPKGWRLPTNNEFWTLLNDHYTTLALMQDEPNFIYSGHAIGGRTYMQGEFGRYWSSSVYNDDYAYSFHVIAPDRVYAGEVDMKYEGYTIRCVAK